MAKKPSAFKYGMSVTWEWDDLPNTIVLASGNTFTADLYQWTGSSWIFTGYDLEVLEGESPFWEMAGWVGDGLPINDYRLDYDYALTSPNDGQSAVGSGEILFSIVDADYINTEIISLPNPL